MKNITFFDESIDAGKAGFFASKDKPIEWSEQQRAFLNWCKNGVGSCVLIAVAGAGKTTVLIEGGRIIRGQVAYMAYNRDIVDETKAKLLAKGIDWKKMQANTAHGFGVGAYRKTRPNVQVVEFKVDNILDEMIKPESALAFYQSNIGKMISLAKQSMFGMLTPIDDVDAWKELAYHYDIFDDEDDVESSINDIIDMCQKALRKSISMLDIIDFDDMIYMPLIHKVRFWRFNVVMVDEAQDTNAARRALVRAMLMPGGRVIAVGDPHQAIYGFTGADADALDLIKKDFNCIELGLTISYRCPQKVVEFAQQWVGHIQAAPTAPIGETAFTTMEDFLKRNDLTVGSAVLCRVNKPLVSLAFQLIRKRIPCRIEGRDVGNGLKKLMTRWKVKKLEGLEHKLDEYVARETTKLLAKKQESKLQNIVDMVETVKVIIDQCRVEKKYLVEDAVAYVDSLFGDKVNDVMVLSSIHKAKGREWQNVFWLDRAGTCPSPYARQEWQQRQERNLCYVAATRSKDKLVELAPAPLKVMK